MPKFFDFVAGQYVVEKAIKATNADALRADTEDAPRRQTVDIQIANSSSEDEDVAMPRPPGNIRIISAPPGSDGIWEAEVSFPVPPADDVERKEVAASPEAEDSEREEAATLSATYAERMEAARKDAALSHEDVEHFEAALSH